MSLIGYSLCIFDKNVNKKYHGKEKLSTDVSTSDADACHFFLNNAVNAL